MLRNITLSADEKLIQQARERAANENSTLNEEFRRWLTQYVQRPKNIADFTALMARLDYAQSGKVFTRQEMNERG